MDVRDATVDDAERVRTVHDASIRGLGGEAYDAKQVDAWARDCESADYAASIADDDGEFLVAVDDGTVVGFGSLAYGAPEGYRTDADAEVTGVYVHPSTAREGIGTALAGELERRARSNGVETLGLQASSNAVPFYERRGYERVRTLEHEFSADEETGVTGTVVEMCKRL